MHFMFFRLCIYSFIWLVVAESVNEQENNIAAHKEDLVHEHDQADSEELDSSPTKSRKKSDKSEKKIATEKKKLSESETKYMLAPEIKLASVIPENIIVREEDEKDIITDLVTDRPSCLKKISSKELKRKPIVKVCMDICGWRVWRRFK